MKIANRFYTKYYLKKLFSPKTQFIKSRLIRLRLIKDNFNYNKKRLEHIYQYNVFDLRIFVDRKQIAFF